MAERDFIRSLYRQASGGRGPLRLGIGDDCAILRPPKGIEIVVTTDFSLENKHFRRDWHPPQSAGHRCLARGLSDLAAMGAKPLAAFLSIAVPKGLEKAYLNGFLRGFMALAKAHSVPLAGGDTAAAPGDELLADITLLGTIPQGKALLRSGAKAGDGIYVTGRLGAAAAELEQLAANATHFKAAKPSEIHPHLFPQPRLAVGQALLKRKLATAAIDISDGLSVDLLHLCEESKLDAEIETATLPLGATLMQALHGGEDYELLFTASRPVPKKLAGVPITRIGTMLPRAGRSPRMSLLDEKGKRNLLKPQGWEHQL
ncbi:MAG: thiamine-phosphate kinase [Acidobacteria bacterium]|nr:thiamine-phosphate kinase [Acidobacteriota bacterium]